MHIVTNPTKQIIPLGNISNYRYCPISLLVYAHLFWSSQDMSSPMTPFSITGFKAMGRAQEAEFQHYWLKKGGVNMGKPTNIAYKMVI